MADQKELVQAGTEVEGTGTSEQESEFLGLSETTPGEVSESGEAEPEKEGGEGAEEEDEEAKAKAADEANRKVEFEKKINAEASKLAQSLKDKELKPIYARISELEKERDGWREKAEAKEDNADSALMFQADTEERGAEIAAKAHEARLKWRADFREHQVNSRKVQQMMRELDEKATVLGRIEKHQESRDEVNRLGVIDPDEADALIKRLDEADNRREWRLILDAIKLERGTKSPKKGFKPSATPSGNATGKQSIFYEDQVEDYDFYAKHEEEILKAQKEGRIRPRR